MEFPSERMDCRYGSCQQVPLEPSWLVVEDKRLKISVLISASPHSVMESS